ncbi:MAG: ribosome hibernation-promoting factor, HPF/YfiA family [Candidatus Chromulinivorax sp.]
MHKKITLRFMQHSDAIEQYIHKKISKLDKFFKREPQPIYIDIVLEAHREKHFFNVEIKIQSVHYHFVVTTQGADMYAMIDQAVDKAVKDIARKKEKLGHALHVSYV